jgi:hypothetical protein
MHAAALLSAAVTLRTDRRPARLCAAPTRCPLQEFLLEVQTSSGGSGPAAVSQIALILAQQLEQRRDDPAAQLTALRWEGVCGGGWVVRDTWQRQVAAAGCGVEPAAPLLLHESNTYMELHWCSHALLQLPADHPPTLPACLPGHHCAAAGGCTPWCSWHPSSCCRTPQHCSRRCCPAWATQASQQLSPAASMCLTAWPAMLCMCAGFQWKYRYVIVEGSRQVHVR